MTIDGSLYPDQEPPRELRALGDRIDYLHRLCAAWDFGILPDAGGGPRGTRPGVA